MADLEDMKNRAALEAGRRAAGRAVGDLLGEDKKQAKDPKRRNKLIAYVVIAGLLVLGVVGFVLSYWQWFFLLGLLGGVGAYGYYRVQKSLAAKKGRSDEHEVEAEAQEAGLRVEVEAEEAAERRRQAAEQIRRQQEEDREAAAEVAQEIEDELAEMKARLGKDK